MRLLMKPWSQMSRGLRVVLATSALIGLLIAPVAALGVE